MLRLIHSQTVVGSLLVDDIDDGLPNKQTKRLGSTANPTTYKRDGYAHVPKQPCYIPRRHPSDQSLPGYIDLVETERVSLSAFRGKIKGFQAAGYLSVISLDASDLDAPTIESAIFVTDFTILGTGFLSVGPVTSRVEIWGPGVGGSSEFPGVVLTQDEIEDLGSFSATEIIIDSTLVPGLATGDVVRVVSNDLPALLEVDVNPGLALLRSSLAWGSTLDQTTVDETGLYSPVTNVTLSVTPGATDHEGGTTAYTLAEDSGNYQHFVDWTPPAALSVGAMYEIEWHYRNSVGSPWNSSVMAIGYATGTFAFQIHQSPRLSRQQGDEMYRGEVRNIDGNWMRCRIWFRAEAAQSMRFYISGTAVHVGAGATVGFMTAPRLKRVSVSAQANLAIGSAALIAQATAADRPKVAPTGWQLASPALHLDADAGHLDITEVPTAISGTAKAWTFAVLLQPRKTWHSQSVALTIGNYFQATGGTASLQIRQTITGIQVLRTNDSGGSATATLPITSLHDVSQVVHVVYDGSTVQLYVQGIALGAAQALNGGAATFTSAQVGAGAVALLAEWAIWSSALSSPQVLASASTLAARRDHSIAAIPLWLSVSQSNGGERGAMTDLSLAAQFPAALGKGVYRHKTNAVITENTNWGPVRIRGTVVSAGFTYGDNVGLFGWERSFFEQVGRAAVTKYVVGGQSLAQFIDGGTFWTEQVTEFHAALDALSDGGMPYSVAGLVNVHGEADINTNAASFTGWLETLRTDLESELGITIPVIIEPRIHVDVAGAQSAALRANLAAWEVADPTSRVLLDIDDLTLQGDGVHYSTSMTVQVGERIHAMAPRVKDI